MAPWGGGPPWGRGPAPWGGGPARRGGRGRAALGLGLAGLALGLAGLALGSSYWCEGRHRVAKEPCPGGAPGGGPGPGGGGNGTADPRAVQYLWEAGDDKFSLRYFHAGFWLSCEEHPGGEVCRSFIQLPPESEKGVLWLAVAAEVAHVALLSGGVGLLALELAAAPSFLGALKMDAFAALLTVLAGLLGMVAHTMYVAVFQLAVSLGPKDWRPHSWSYGWSFGAAWLSFALCMAAAVLALNAYTQTLLQLQRRRRPPRAPPRQPGGDAEPC